MSDSKCGGRGGNRRSDPSKPPGVSAPAKEAEEIERALKMGPGDFPPADNWNPSQDMANPKEKAKNLIDMLGKLETLLKDIPLDESMRGAMERMKTAATETLEGIQTVETSYTNMHEQYKNANHIVQIGFNPDLPMPNRAEILAEQAAIPPVGAVHSIAAQAPPLDLSAANQNAASDPSGSAPSQDINAMISAALFSHIEKIASASGDQTGSSAGSNANREFRFTVPPGVSMAGFDATKIPKPAGVECDVTYYPQGTVLDANGVPSAQPLPPPPSSMMSPPMDLLDSKSSLLTQLLIIQQQFHALGMQGTFFEQPSCSQDPSNQPPPTS